MTKYIVHCVSRATDRNENFAGDVVESYSGKGGHGCGLYHYSAKNGFVVERKLLPDYDAKMYGYDRISDARRNYTFKNPQNDDFWQSNVEIIAIEVKD